MAACRSTARCSILFCTIERRHATAKTGEHQPRKAMRPAGKCRFLSAGKGQDAFAGFLRCQSSSLFSAGDATEREKSMMYPDLAESENARRFPRPPDYAASWGALLPDFVILFQGVRQGLHGDPRLGGTKELAGPAPIGAGCILRHAFRRSGWRYRVPANCSISAANACW